MDINQFLNFYRNIFGTQYIMYIILKKYTAENVEHNR